MTPFGTTRSPQYHGPKAVTRIGKTHLFSHPDDSHHHRAPSLLHNLLCLPSSHQHPPHQHPPQQHPPHQHPSHQHPFPQHPRHQWSSSIGQENDERILRSCTVPRLEGRPASRPASVPKADCPTDSVDERGAAMMAVHQTPHPILHPVLPPSSETSYTTRDRHPHALPSSLPSSLPPSLPPSLPTLSKMDHVRHVQPQFHDRHGYRHSNHDRRIPQSSVRYERIRRWDGDGGNHYSSPAPRPPILSSATEKPVDRHTTLHSPISHSRRQNSHPRYSILDPLDAITPPPPPPLPFENSNPSMCILSGKIDSGNKKDSDRHERLRLDPLKPVGSIKHSSPFTPLLLYDQPARRRCVTTSLFVHGDSNKNHNSTWGCGSDPHQQHSTCKRNDKEPDDEQLRCFMTKPSEEDPSTDLLLSLSSHRSCCLNSPCAHRNGSDDPDHVVSTSVATQLRASASPPGLSFLGLSLRTCDPPQRDGTSITLIPSHRSETQISQQGSNQTSTVRIQSCPSLDCIPTEEEEEEEENSHSSVDPGRQHSLCQPCLTSSSESNKTTEDEEEEEEDNKEDAAHAVDVLMASEKTEDMKTVQRPSQVPVSDAPRPSATRSNASSSFSLLFVPSTVRPFSARTLDEEDRLILHLAVLTLYKDQIKPQQIEIKHRLQELRCSAFVGKHFLRLYEEFPDRYRVERSSPSSSSSPSPSVPSSSSCESSSSSSSTHTAAQQNGTVYLRETPGWFSGWVDVRDPHNPYPFHVWLSLDRYIESLLQFKPTQSPDGISHSGGSGGGGNGLPIRRRCSSPMDSLAPLERDLAPTTNGRSAAPVSVPSVSGCPSAPWMDTRGGRYGLSKRLKSKGPSVFQKYSLGQVCHIVQLAVRLELLSYDGGSLLPTASCRSMARRFMPSVDCTHDDIGLDPSISSYLEPSNVSSTKMNLEATKATGTQVSDGCTAIARSLSQQQRAPLQPLQPLVISRPHAVIMANDNSANSQYPVVSDLAEVQRNIGILLNEDGETFTPMLLSQLTFRFLHRFKQRLDPICFGFTRLSNFLSEQCTVSCRLLREGGRQVLVDRVQHAREGEEGEEGEGHKKEGEEGEGHKKEGEGHKKEGEGEGHKKEGEGERGEEGEEGGRDKHGQGEGSGLVHSVTCGRCDTTQLMVPWSLQDRDDQGSSEIQRQSILLFPSEAKGMTTVHGDASLGHPNGAPLTMTLQSRDVSSPLGEPTADFTTDRATRSLLAVVAKHNRFHSNLTFSFWQFCVEVNRIEKHQVHAVKGSLYGSSLSTSSLFSPFSDTTSSLSSATRESQACGPHPHPHPHPHHDSLIAMAFTASNTLTEQSTGQHGNAVLSGHAMDDDGSDVPILFSPAGRFTDFLFASVLRPAATETSQTQLSLGHSQAQMSLGHSQEQLSFLTSCEASLDPWIGTESNSTHELLEPRSEKRGETVGETVDKAASFSSMSHSIRSAPTTAVEHSPRSMLEPIAISEPGGGAAIGSVVTSTRPVVPSVVLLPMSHQMCHLQCFSRLPLIERQLGDRGPLCRDDAEALEDVLFSVLPPRLPVERDDEQSEMMIERDDPSPSSSEMMSRASRPSKLRRHITAQMIQLRREIFLPTSPPPLSTTPPPT